MQKWQIYVLGGAALGALFGMGGGAAHCMIEAGSSLWDVITNIVSEAPKCDQAYAIQATWTGIGALGGAAAGGLTAVIESVRHKYRHTPRHTQYQP